MRIAFFGTPTEVIPILDALASHFTVAFIVTTPDRRAGRKQLITPPPVKQYALEHAIPVLQPASHKEMIAQIGSIPADIFVVASYGKIIPQQVLDMPKYGCINIHPSLLPQYRGPTPIQTTLLNQETETGITFILMDAAVDHGPILGQIPYAITKDDTFASLMQGMFARSAEVLPTIIKEYVDGTITPARQDDSQASFTHHITKQQGFLDLDNLPDKQTLDAMIRAYYPWPGVWTNAHMRDREVRIKLLPGKKLQIEGKSPVRTQDFINAYPELKDFVEKMYE